MLLHERNAFYDSSFIKLNYYYLFIIIIIYYLTNLTTIFKLRLSRSVMMFDVKKYVHTPLNAKSAKNAKSKQTKRSPDH